MREDVNAEEEHRSSDPVRVVLVDDNAMFRRGLRMLLVAQGIAVVGEASDGRDAIAMARDLSPQVVVMDTDMPVMNGIEATAQITRIHDAPRVLVLADKSGPAALDVILAGACGMLLKDSDAVEIAGGVRLAAMGQSVLAPVVAATLVVRMRELERARRTQRPKSGAAALTNRERDVLTLLSAGRDNVDIGSELFISCSTVKHHVASILEKLQVGNRTQAAVEAVRAGLA